MADIHSNSAQPINPNEKLPHIKAAILGLQHLLAMYSGDVLIPLLVGAALHFNAAQMTYLVSVDIFMCGVATLLQLKRTPLTGIALPVVLGCAVEYVGPLTAIGTNSQLGIDVMYGSIIGAGIFILLVSGLFARLRWLFPPVVTGSLITLIGFTLIPVAFQNLGGGDVAAKSFGSTPNLIAGFSTIALILIFSIWGRGFIQQIAILIGIIAGTLIAAAIGIVSLDPVGQASWFKLPELFYFGTPHFEWSSIVSMSLAALTTMIESIGVFFALGEIVGRDITSNDLKRGFRAEGIAAILGGLFNTFPYSTFSQNVGIVQLSGIKTKKPVYYSAFFLIILGLLPKIGAVATIIPSAVLGGAMVVMFGTVGIQGIKMLHKVDLDDNRNLLVAAVSIGLGLGVAIHPTLLQSLPTSVRTILGNGLVVGSLSAVILNLLFNYRSLIAAKHAEQK